MSKPRPNPSRPNLPPSVRLLTLAVALTVVAVLVTPLLGRTLRATRRVAARVTDSPVNIPVDAPTVTPVDTAQTPQEPPAIPADYATRRWDPPRGTRTVAGAQSALGDVARAKFEPECQKFKIAYPPQRITLLAFKDERRLEVWAANRTGDYHKIGEYPILAASGGLGPKRREGDRQVPEGVYRLTTLNPNSQFHLSLRVDYPNTTDTANRLKPNVPMGGDIYVHGNAVSIGCIAIGDPSIEELFTLVSLSAPRQRRILIAPVDLRVRPAPEASEPWITTLYGTLARNLKPYTTR